MHKLKIGFAAGFMEGFSTEGLKMFETYKKDLSRMAAEMNFDLVCFDTIIQNMEQAFNVRKEIDSKDIDFVLLFHPSYIIGDFIFEIMKSRAEFGLWAIEELFDEGPMPLASLVNVMQNSSIAQHNFKGKPKKTKWFFGDINGKYFRPRFEITVRVLSAIKALKDARVAQIGKLADGHINHMVDVREIYKNLGVDVSRDYEVEDIIALGNDVAGKDINRELDRIKSVCRISRVGVDKIIDSIKMYLAIKKICKENSYSAVAFSCWPKLMPMKEMVGCLVNSMLNSDGIVAGCEADVLGTISMMVLRLLTKKPVAIMDLPKFDDKDDSLLLWHCGSAPFEMANSKGVTCDKHYFADYDESIKNCGPITDIIFTPGDVTVFRLTGESDYFYYFTGKVFNDNKKSFNGSRGWVNGLRLYDEAIASIDLANTILTNGIPHHFPMVLANVGKYLEEFAYWLDLKKIKRLDYKDYLYV
jgi:L-fucose isomerase-like protein